MREAARSRSGERGRVTRGVLLCALAAILASLALVSSASALPQRGHVFAGSFGGEGSGDGQLKEPAGVAVSEATGDIYVVDSGNNRVVEFGPDHKFIRTWGWGVKDAKKEFEICESGCQAGLGGHRVGQLHTAGAIAIDQQTNKATDPSAGDIYVETVAPYEEIVEGHEFSYEYGIVEKFLPNGKLAAKSRIKNYKQEAGESAERFEGLNGLTVGTAGTLYIYDEEKVVSYTNEEPNKFKALVKSEAEGEGKPGIAVDSNGLLYLAHEGAGHGEPPTVIAKEMVFKEGEELLGEPLIEALTGEASSAVAVDEANNDVLVDNEGSVGVFDTTGELIERFGKGQLQRGTGMAALANGDALVADAATGQIDVFEAEPPGAPTIDDLSVREISATAAKLEAQIDPTDLATSYVFRYDTAPLPKAGEPCTGTCVEAPLPAGELAATYGAVTAGPQEITGLKPATLYHYTVIALNSSAPGGVEGPQQKFHTLNTVLGSTLPDNRVWEKVSPLDKNGASIEAPTKEGGLIEAAEDGKRVTYVATGAFPGAEGNRAPEVTQVLGVRGEKEWQNTDLDTQQVRGLGVIPGSPPEYRAFSSDLAEMIVEPVAEQKTEPHKLSPEAGESTPWVRSGATECLTPPAPTVCFKALLTAGNVPAETEVEGNKVKTEYGGNGNVEFRIGDKGLKHLILQAKGSIALSAEPAGSKGNIYEYLAGQNTLVSILPNGHPAGEKPKEITESQEEPVLGGGGRNITRALSSDGSRVIWSTQVLGQAAHLFVRDLAAKETVKLDEPQPGAETNPPRAHAIFQTASTDGSHIFFTDEQRLTTNSTASAKEARPDLYDCHLVKNAETKKLECELFDLTVDQHVGESADVQGLVPGASADGTRVYFVANGALGAGTEAGHCVELEENRNKGKFRLTATCNLYTEHYNSETHTWEAPELIAVLSAEDEPNWFDPVTNSQAKLTSRVSPEGNYLTFVSDRSLTGYHNKDSVSGKPDTEVYLYNASANRLTCVSCNPTGARPTGVIDTEFAGEGRGRLVDRPLVWEGRWLSGTIATWTHLSLVEAPYPSRVVLDSGRVYFASAESLVPQDTNGKEDVYQYEPAGVGGCTTASETYGETSEGCVSLLSSGTSANESVFLDASANGNDVFLLTSSKLTTADTDTSFDVYDATLCGQPETHECLPTPASSPPPCEEIDTCRGSSTEPGAQFAAPGSAAANGSTNSSAIEVRGSKETELTNAQKLAKQLPVCRKLANSGKRLACERTAILKYGTKAQKLAVSIRACRKLSGHKRRKSCEALARKHYATAKKAAHGARSGR